MFFKAKQEVDYYVVVVGGGGDQSWRLVVFLKTVTKKQLPVMCHWIWPSSFQRCFLSNCWRTFGRRTNTIRKAHIALCWAKKDSTNSIFILTIFLDKVKNHHFRKLRSIVFKSTHRRSLLATTYLKSCARATSLYVLWQDF